MKKLLSLLLASLLAIAATGCQEEETHIHDYTVKKMDDMYLASPQSCITGRLYYYVCSGCGQSSGAEKDPRQQFIWQGSDALGHALSVDGCTRKGCNWSPIDSGTLANEMQWAYFPDGELHFFGSGALPDWTEENLQSGEIPGTGYAVRTGVLPKTISAIGDRSFAGLSKLTNISIPWGVTSIGASAFDGCTALATLELPDSLNVIKADAFRSCTALTAVKLPRYANYLEGNVFAGCTKLAALTVDEANTVFKIQNGCLVETTTGTLVAAPLGSSIPTDGSILAISASALEGRTDLTALHLPASVVTIGEKAFYGCSNLTSITVDEANEHFSAKGNCLIRRTDKTLILGCSTSEIPVNGSVTTIGDHAFAGSDKLTAIHIPATISMISSSAFSDCPQLTTITAAQGNTHYNATNNCLIVSGTRTLLLGCKNSVIPADGSVIRIGNNAFAGSGIQSVVIPDAVTEIGESAFENCTALTSLTIGKGITTATALNAKAFSGCSALESVSLAEGHPTFTVELRSIIEISTRTLLLGTNRSSGKDGPAAAPLHLTAIGDYAFAGRMLESFYIAKTVHTIGEGAFYGCSKFYIIAYEEGLEEWEKINLGKGWSAFSLFPGEPNLYQ